MAWEKGQSGNPAGGPGRPKEKPFADALRIALTEECPVTQKRKLRAIADKLVDAALVGEAWAIKEVMDRIDGKPVQSAEVNATVDHNHTHHSEPISETVSWIEGLLRERQNNKAPKSRPN
jgi:hypothetical protein